MTDARRAPLAEYPFAALIVVLCTAANFIVFRYLTLTDVVMVYLVGVGLVASRYRRGPSIFASFLSIALFNFWFVPPRFTLAVADVRYLLTFGVMLGTALVISTLTLRIREQAERVQREQVEIQAERLRTSLLSSLSHDLRTPLGAITGAASTLLEDRDALTNATRRDLLETILEEVQRMNRLIGNLLDMIRVESGSLQAQKEWQPMEEPVGVALIRLEDRLQRHPVTVSLPADLPLVPLDGVLIEQVFVNLLENAVKYTPDGTTIEIAARETDGLVLVEVADRGPGLPPGEEHRVFEKFHRAPGDSAAGGIGLGLSICRGIVTAHGGRIWAENRPGGGAVFRFTLPLTGAPPPAVPTAESAE